MDTNQPTTPAVPTNPVPQVTPVQTQGSTGGENKNLSVVVVILVILVILAGGFVLLRNTQFSKFFGSQKPVQTVVNVFDDLKKELQSIDVGASESDLSSFDKDLNSL